MAVKFCEHGYESGIDCPKNCLDRSGPEYSEAELRERGVTVLHTLDGPHAEINPPRKATATRVARSADVGGDVGGPQLHIFNDPILNDADVERLIAETYEEVNHPAHYLPGVYETYRIIEAYGLDFYRGIALKHLLRAGRKPGMDFSLDLQKARWYLRRAAERSREQAEERGVSGSTIIAAILAEYRLSNMADDGVRERAALEIAAALDLLEPGEASETE